MSALHAGRLPVEAMLPPRRDVRTGSVTHPSSSSRYPGGRNVKLTTHLHLVTRLRMFEVTVTFIPSCPHGVVLN
jgi:hypothetical protein